MINIHEITASSVDENLKLFIEEIKSESHANLMESEAGVYKALMKFSCILLKKYHEALKQELSKHGINI